MRPIRWRRGYRPTARRTLKSGSLSSAEFPARSRWESRRWRLPPVRSSCTLRIAGTCPAIQNETSWDLSSVRRGRESFVRCRVRGCPDFVLRHPRASRLVARCSQSTSPRRRMWQSRSRLSRSARRRMQRSAEAPSASFRLHSVSTLCEWSTHRVWRQSRCAT